MSALLAAANPDLFGRLLLQSIEPPLRWPGRKDRLVARIQALLPDHTEQMSWVEPFTGSGAVLAAMTVPFAEYRLSDVGRNVMGFHAACRDDLQALLRSAEPLFAAEQTTDFYAAVRDALNTGVLAETDRAAAWLYLNRTCFNGVVRENRRGEFNTPWSRNLSPVLDRRVLSAWSQRLLGVELECRDFRDAFEQAGEGAVIYCDPPYVGTFDGYSAGGFSANKQAELAMLAQDAADRGAHVVISNSAAGAELYEGATSVQRLAVARSVAANGDRQAAEEILVVYAPQPRLAIGWRRP
jgi:DNA adenine methylase